MELTYEKLTKDNLALIQDLQHRIFPETSFEEGYAVCLEKGPQACGNVMQEYYIAYADGEPAGTYGLYIPDGVEEHHSIWLGWYGILPTFRGKGIGKKILMDSMEKARTYMEEYGVKYYRLYTSEAINDTAQPLYNKVMTLKEYYRNAEMFTDEMFAAVRQALPGRTEEEYRNILSHAVAIFSLRLGQDILVPWDNYYMSLDRTRAMEKDYTKK